MVEVIEITFFEQGKSAKQTIPVSSDMRLRDFQEAAQTLLSLPDNLPYQIALERTGEVLPNALNFAEAGIKNGDKLIFIPLSEEDSRERKNSDSTSGDFSVVNAEEISTAKKTRSLVPYILQLTVINNGQQTETYEYPIELEEFNEDNTKEQH